MTDATPKTPLTAAGGDAVAVVGMAARLPGAPDLETFWDNLARGVESVTTFGPDALAAAGVAQELARRPEYVPAGAVLDGADRFDAGLFGYSPREAALLDPQQRLFLETAWAAFEDAGLDPRRSTGGGGGRTGVFAGAGLNRYLLDHVYPALDPADPAAAYQAALANDKDFLATRVSYKLGLEGPSLTIQTACSTSLVAVAAACQSLATGDCDLALAGGVTLRLPLGAGYLFQEEGILSPDGHCRAFDAGARGTVPGSGVGAVVLERLEDAVAAGRPVRAVLRGWATNNDGSGKAGFTAPRVEGQARVVAEALALAGVDPETVGYVEAHGTGTRLGDPIEVAALARAFGGGPAPGSVLLGSVKTNIGHLDAAAGVAGLVKAVLILEHGEVPPSLHFREPNPEIDWRGGPFRVVSEPTPLPSNGRPRRVGVSSFGIGGTNAHVVLEEAPPAVRGGRARGPDRPRLFVLSAASDDALERSAGRLAEHLRRHPELDSGDVAHTLLAGRAALERRRAVVTSRLDEAADLHAGGPSPRRLEGVATGGPAPVAFLFPGQGSQYAGMGAELYAVEPVFRRGLDRCAEILAPHLDAEGGPLDLLLRTGGEPSAPDPLEDTALAQPLLLALEHSLARLWMSWGVVPEALLGHSVGEWTAACLAGVIDLEEALPLVAERGRRVAALPPGAMLAVPLAEEAVASLLAGRSGGELALAAVNAPELCAVSGPPAAVEDLAAALATDGVATRRLHTSHAFHSRMVGPAVEPFRQRVERCRLRPPRIPFLSNLTGTWIREEEATDPGYWARHLREPVRFSAAAAALLAEPRRALLEVGPGDSLAKLVRRQPDGRGRVVVSSLPHAADSASDVETLLEAAGRLWVGGVAAGGGFADLGRPASGAPEGVPPRRRVRLPTYPFAGERHWIEARGPRPGEGAAPEGGILRKEPDPADWFYLPSWRRIPPVEVASSREGADAEPWLVLAGDEDLGDRVAAELDRRGETPAVVRPGPEAGTGGTGPHIVRRDEPDALAEDLDALLASLADEGRTPGKIVYLWSLDGTRATPAVLATLVRSLSHRLHGREVDLAVVTDRLFDLAGEGGRRPERAALAGLARVVAQEHPAIRCRLVDLDLGGAPAAAAAALLDELARPAPGPMVALRGPYRFEPFQERHRLVGTEETSREAGGHYLVTGGLGRFALAVAERLAERAAGAGDTPLRLTLLDRRGPEDAPGVPARLEGLRAKAEVAVVLADVADAGAVAGAVTAAVERAGPLSGVIHAAGAPAGAYRTLSELTAEDWREHLGPKVDGLENLAAALEGAREAGGEPLRAGAWVLAASSLAPVLGGVGLAPFAAADAALDAVVEAHDRERRAGARWRSVNWEGWEDLADAGGGIAGTALGRQQSALMMSAEEVGEAFERVLGLPGPARVVVATGDLPARVAQWSDVLRRRGARDGGSGRARPAGAPPYRPPSGPVETRIAAAWSELLGIERIGADDDFFLFGGDSLVGLQVLSKLRAELDVELPLRSFFEARTVAGMAAVVEEERRRGDEEERRLAEILAEIEGLSDDEVAVELQGEEER